MKRNSWKSPVQILCLLLLCLGTGGCALLAIPGQIIGGVFGLLGQAVQVAGNMPMPPPWMFF